MKTGIKYTTIVAATCVSLATLLTAFAVAQQQSESRVKQTAYTRPASQQATQQVTFARQPAHIGDQVEQDIGLELRMTMTMRQANEMIGKNQTHVRTDQKRVLTTT